MNFTNGTLEEGLLSNSTNLTDFVRLKRHLNFLGEEVLKEKCNRPHFYEESIMDSCNFVVTAETCSKAVEFCNYLKIMVCYMNFDTSDRGLLMIAVISSAVLTFYLTLLFILAKYFLMPNCLVFYNYVKLKQYDYSVLIVSFLFQFPEILRDMLRCFHFNKTYALMNSSIISRIFMSMLWNIILMGIYANDIKIRGMHLVREVAFITLGTALWHGSCRHDMFNLNHLPEYRSEPIIVYMAYFDCAIFCIFLLTIILFWKQKVNIRQSITSIPRSSDSLESDDYPTILKYPTETEVDPWLQFVDNVNPFLNITNTTFVVRVFLSPLFLAISLFVPVVRMDRPLRGWCKLLFAISFLCWPAYFAMSDVNTPIFVGLTLISALGLLMIIFLTHSQRLPKLHNWISFWGLIIGFLIVSIISSEMNVLVWQTCHYVLNWNDDTIVLNGFCLGYVFVESILVVQCIKMDHAEMSLGIIMGSAIMSVYLTLILLPFSLCFHNNQYFVLTSPTNNTFTFFYIMLLFLVSGVPLSDLKFRISHSSFFIMVFVLYYTMLMLFEYDVAHPFGTIHQKEVFPDVFHANWA